MEKSQAAYICEQPKSKVTATTGISTDRRGLQHQFSIRLFQVSKTYEIKNSGKMKTILSKICGQKNNFKSKATTEWGKANEPVARQEYIKLKAKDHKNLVL